MRGIERRGLEDKLHRLAGRHEESGGRRVGDRHWPPGGNLFLKERHDRPRRAQHVAEAHGDKAGGGGGLASQRLALHFGQPLGHAQYAGRIGPLVGRDQNHCRDVVVLARARDGARTDDVGEKRFVRVLFGQRDMFEGGGMEHQLGPLGGKHMGNSRGVAHVGKHRTAADGRMRRGGEVTAAD